MLNPATDRVDISSTNKEDNTMHTTFFPGLVRTLPRAARRRLFSRSSAPAVTPGSDRTERPVRRGLSRLQTLLAPVTVAAALVLGTAFSIHGASANTFWANQIPSSAYNTML